jgi:hypothetical protein
VNKSQICCIPACWFVSQITTSRASLEEDDELLLLDVEAVESVELELLVSELLLPQAVKPATIDIANNNAVNFFFIK